ncbi:MAG: glycosyltransferase family 4 protein [Pseudomonadota bacterium]
MHTKPILFISPLPPPQGGIAVWTKKIITEGLPDKTPVTLVDTRIRGARNIFDPAFFSVAEISRTLRIYFLLLYQLIANRPRLTHLSCALSSAGIFRDAVCIALAKLFRVPIVTHYHGNMQDFHAACFRGLSGKALRWVMRNSAINIVANTLSFHCAQQRVPDVKNLILLPNFIEDKIFNYQKPTRRPDQRLRAIYAGGITAAKGAAEILLMAQRFPTCDFHLFGKMHADMAQLYQNIPANLSLHGEVAHDVLLQEMCLSDFLLFPSYTEGFPLTVLEAMAVGLPVIATNVGGIPEMIIDGAGGLLVQARDSAALTVAMQTFINNPQQLAALGQFNKQKSYDEFRYSIVMARLLSIYSQVTGGEPCVA